MNNFIKSKSYLLIKYSIAFSLPLSASLALSKVSHSSELKSPSTSKIDNDGTKNDDLSNSVIKNKTNDVLRNWELNQEQGKIFRKSPNEIEKDRKVIVLVGITGAGKSSTANTLSGRTERSGDRFELSNSVVSVTSSAAFRDYEFMNHSWRIIDTPGLKDTNSSQQDTVDELSRIAEFAPHGISAFIVVIPHGRFTEENSLAVQHLRNILSTANPEQKDAINDYFIVAVTSCRQKRDALVDVCF